MAPVRAVVYDLLRALGLTTIFGNPGSTEEPFLADFPEDFRYILGLQEAVVVAMADGFAQASGRPAFVNLHTASGMGNGMGALVTAWHNRTPLIVTAGQQTREMLALEPWLVNRDATQLPRPYVKWSHEPTRAEDVPAAIERAYHLASAPPQGPVFVSIPMDDWGAEVEPRSVRRVAHRVEPDAKAIESLAAELAAAQRPVLVVGGGVDRAGGWEAAVRLAERLRLPVWEAPAPERASFPQNHQLFQGPLPLAMLPLSERLQGSDLVLVAGAPVFRYYPHIPGPILPSGARLVQLTDDPDEAARAPAGDAIVGDVGIALERLAATVPEVHRTNLPPRPQPVKPAATDPISVPFAMEALARAMPTDSLVAEESASSRAAFYDHIRIVNPASYFATASGGLGFALPAAVGVALARPERPVLCIVGDGAAMFAIQAIWSAGRYGTSVVFAVINNGQYGILKAFAAFQRTPGVPGLDLPGIDIAAIARGMGVHARRVSEAAELLEACQDAFTTAMKGRRPVLLDIIVNPEIGTLFGQPTR